MTQIIWDVPKQKYNLCHLCHLWMILLSADLDGQNFTRLPEPASAAVSPGQAATLGYADGQGHRTDLAIPAGSLTLTPMLDGMARPGAARAAPAV